MKTLEIDDRRPYQREAWSYIRALLPPDPELERWAREMGALRRRRGVKAAAALLRILLSYACCTFSLKGTSEWAQDSDWAQKLNKNALRQRLLKAAPWLQHLLDWVVGQRTSPRDVAGYRVVLADGTRIAPPGSKGASWCAHSLLEPWTGQTLQLQLTDPSGGEHLGRFQLAANDLVVADAGYAHRRGLTAAAEQGAAFLVRMNWSNLPLQTRHGRDFDLFKSIEHLKTEQTAEFKLRTKYDRKRDLPALPVRLLVYRKTEEEAERSRKRAMAEARKKKRKADPRTLLACQYIFLVTNVPSEKLSATELFSLYRLRWQVELAFKRWKSLMNVDELHARHPDSIRAVLTAKLLGAILVEAIAAAKGSGPDLWHRTRLAAHSFRHALLGEQGVRKSLDLAPAPRAVDSNRRRSNQPDRVARALRNRIRSREQLALTA